MGRGVCGSARPHKGHFFASGSGRGESVGGVSRSVCLLGAPEPASDGRRWGSIGHAFQNVPFTPVPLKIRLSKSLSHRFGFRGDLPLWMAAEPFPGCG